MFRKYQTHHHILVFNIFNFKPVLMKSVYGLTRDTVADFFAIISGPFYSAIRYAKLLTVTSLLIHDHGCSLFKIPGFNIHLQM